MRVLGDFGMMGRDDLKYETSKREAVSWTLFVFFLVKEEGTKFPIWLVAGRLSWFDLHPQIVLPQYER
jgi:hypothetical protein